MDTGQENHGRFCWPICLLSLSRVKESLVLEPGTSKISIRTSIYFHPMSDGQVKNTVQGYISLNVQHYLAIGQVNI